MSRIGNLDYLADLEVLVENSSWHNELESLRSRFQIRSISLTHTTELYESQTTVFKV
jgi:hypothetical protein